MNSKFVKDVLLASDSLTRKVAPIVDRICSFNALIVIFFHCRRVKLVSRDTAAFAGSSTSEQEDTGIRLFKLSRRLLKTDGEDQKVENGKTTTGQTNSAARRPFVRKRKRHNSSRYFLVERIHSILFILLHAICTF